MELFYDDIVIKKKLLIDSGTLHVQKNSINVIQGKNGSGKTLLLKNISQNKKNGTLSMALLDQSNEVTIPNCSILESVSLDDDKEKQKYISGKIRLWGLGYLLELKNGKLSGGEQRIVNILRSIFSDAQIILMDEPTNDLDFNMVEKLLWIFKKVKQEKTLIIISHDDRVSKIADNIYQVIDHELRKAGEQNVYENSNESEVNPFTGNKIKEKSILKKIFSYNYVNIILLIVLAFVIMMQVSSFKSIAPDNDERNLPENEIILCSIYSNELSYCGLNSAIPLNTYRSLSSLDITKNLSAIKDIEYILNKYNVEFYEVHLESTDQYTTYPLEYYSIEHGDSINVLDYYIEKYYGDENREINIDPSAYFSDVIEKSNYDKTYNLDLERYNECIKELGQNKNYIIIAEAVVFNEGYDAESFYCSEKADDLGKHLIFAYSEKIKELSYQLSIFRTAIQSLKVVLMAMLLLLIVNCGTVKLIMLNYKNLIYLFRNYDYDITKIENAMINRINNRIPMLVVLFVFLLSFLLYFKNLQISEIKYIFCFCAMFFCSALYSIENREISRYIQKYYRWDAR